jgi:hypothetical protein
MRYEQHIDIRQPATGIEGRACAYCHAHDVGKDAPFIIRVMEHKNPLDAILADVMYFHEECLTKYEQLVPKMIAEEWISVCEHKAKIDAIGRPQCPHCQHDLAQDIVRPTLAVCEGCQLFFDGVLYYYDTNEWGVAGEHALTALSSYLDQKNAAHNGGAHVA